MSLAGQDLPSKFVFAILYSFQVKSKYLKMNVSESNIPGASLNERLLAYIRPTSLVLMQLVFSHETFMHSVYTSHKMSNKLLM